MEIYISEQLLSALYSAILGAFFGAVYDHLRFFRHLIHSDIRLKGLKNKLICIKQRLNKAKIIDKEKKAGAGHKIELFFWDLLFFIIIIPIAQIFVYATSFGIVRWYILVGISVGFAIYLLIPARFTKFVYDPIIFLLLTFLELIKHPFRKANLNIKAKRSARKERKKALKAKIKTNKSEIIQRQSILISVGKKM